MPSAKLSSRRGSMRSGGRFAARHAEASHLPTPYDAMPINDLWERYHAAPDESMRNFFMERFLPLVRYNAERIHARLPDEVDIEDLMSAGLFGLMDAIDAFDLSRKVEQARQAIEKASGQPATDEQVAKMLNVEGEEFDKLKRDSSAVATRSLTQRCYNNDGGGREVRELDVVKDDGQFNPVSDIQRRDLKELITKGLSRAERLIVVLYYYEGMTMKEIGSTLDLSESRVSQMHSSILARLKTQMQHRERELEPVD